MLPEKRSKKNTLLSVPKPGFTSALSKIYSFTSEELLFEPTLDLLSKQKLCSLPSSFLKAAILSIEALASSIETEKHVRCLGMGNVRGVCDMHLFSPSVLFTFKQTLQPQRQVFV